MKIIQFKDEQGNNCYIAADNITSFKSLGPHLTSIDTKYGQRYLIHANTQALMTRIFKDQPLEIIETAADTDGQETVLRSAMNDHAGAQWVLPLRTTPADAKKKTAG